MKGEPTGTCHPPKNLKGVQVVFEDEKGDLRCFWVDLKAVQGLSWCDEEPPHRGNPPRGKRPAQARPPDGYQECSPLSAQEAAQLTTSSLGGGGGPFEDPPLCWWTGSRWECGEM